MNFATGYSFNTKDIFANFPTKKMKISGKDCERLFKDKKRRNLAIRVFLYAAKVVLLDIIQNNVIFKFPTQRPCYLRMVRTHGDDFAKARRNGKWQDVDYLKSNFSGYQMQFMYIANEREIKKPVFLDSKLKGMITENTNNGMQYY